MNSIFSVIVLSYNNLQYMEECLNSILSQDYGKIEIVFADDGSKQFNEDDVKGFIEKHNRGNIVKCIIQSNQENLGTVKNINNAIRLSGGDYIKLIAVDDALYDSKVLSVAKESLDTSECGIVLADTITCDAKLIPNGSKAKLAPSRISEMDSKSLFRKLCKTNIIDACGVFFLRDFFERYGLFDEKYRLLEDWPKWLEIFQNGCRLNYMPAKSVKYRCNCGVGTGINHFELQDKRTAFDAYVRPSKKELGLCYYSVCKLRFYLTTSKFVRKLYGSVYRKSD